MTATLDTDVLIIGSGAGGAVTAATVARAGRAVTIVEEGPWVDPDAMEPFSLEEMVAAFDVVIVIPESASFALTRARVHSSPIASIRSQCVAL